MSPKLLDPNRKLPNRGRAAQSGPAEPVGHELLFNRGSRPLLELPMVLDRFVDKKPAVVMFRIATDWIIQGTPFDQLFEETAEGQYTREFTLDIWPLSCSTSSAAIALRSARLSWIANSSSIASLSAFYGKLNRMELGITAEVARTSELAAAN